MNLNLHSVPMNVCKNSDQYLKGKHFYFFHNMIEQKKYKNDIEYSEFYNLLYKKNTLFFE